MNNYTDFTGILKRYMSGFHPVVPFDPKKEKAVKIDLSSANSEITESIYNDTALFTAYLNNKRSLLKAKYLIGGYNELRAVYDRSSLFGNEQTKEEPRRLHIGTDIWGDPQTPVRLPLGGMIHSLAFNDHFGDYGATIIVLHQLDTIPFYTLYGHLSLADLSRVQPGKFISRGEVIGHFGLTPENGNWPPHLHFQIIVDMEMKEGDYPGVCKYSERDKYLSNCPDPDFILQMNQWLE